MSSPVSRLFTLTLPSSTSIFEWEESKPDLCKCLYEGELVHPPELDMGIVATLPFSVSGALQLMKLAKARGIDGYLLNVETDLNFLPPIECYPGGSQEREEDADFLRREKEVPKGLPLLFGEIKDRRERRMKRNALALCNWTKWFTRMGKKIVGPNWEVIWLVVLFPILLLLSHCPLRYDSVTMEGQLRWQDALTTANAPFFMNSDGIFTNYTWARPPDPVPPGGLEEISQPKAKYHPKLLYSSLLAKELKRDPADVYIGIDLFGRNCYGGYEIGKSLDMIFPRLARPVREGGEDKDQDLDDDELEELGLSVALFAPGWTWEREKEGGGERSWKEWWEDDKRLWVGNLSSFPSEPSEDRTIGFYFSRRRSSGRPRPSSDESMIPAPFYSNFSFGSGTSWWSNGLKVFEPFSTEEDPYGRRGWTDLGVTFPKPDRIWPRAELLKRGEMEGGPSNGTATLSPLERVSPGSWRIRTASLANSEVWQGDASLEIICEIPNDSSTSQIIIPIRTLDSAKVEHLTGYKLDAVLKASPHPETLQLQPVLIWVTDESNVSCTYSMMDSTTSQADDFILINGWFKSSVRVSAPGISPSANIVPVFALQITAPSIPELSSLSSFRLLVGEISLSRGSLIIAPRNIQWKTLPPPSGASDNLLWGKLEWDLPMYTPVPEPVFYFNVFVSGNRENLDAEKKDRPYTWLGTTTYGNSNSFIVAGLDANNVTGEKDNGFPVRLFSYFIGATHSVLITANNFDILHTVCGLQH